MLASVPLSGEIRLITQRSQVQILAPQPNKFNGLRDFRVTRFSLKMANAPKFSSDLLMKRTFLHQVKFLSSDFLISTGNTR